MSAFLLDSNVLVHYVRDDECWSRLRIRFNLLSAEINPLVTVVSHGEILSLSRRWKWGGRRKNRLDFVLGFFRKVTIDDPAIVDHYATIESDCRARGFKLGKNDFWIAATAVAMGSTVLTTDRDFTHINATMFSWVWVDPHLSTGTA